MLLKYTELIKKDVIEFVYACLTYQKSLKDLLRACVLGQRGNMMWKLESRIKGFYPELFVLGKFQG